MSTIPNVGFLSRVLCLEPRGVAVPRGVVDRLFNCNKKYCLRNKNLDKKGLTKNIQKYT